MVNKGQIVGIDWNYIARLHSHVLAHMNSLKLPSQGKLKLPNSCWQTQVGVCERLKNRRQTRLQTDGVSLRSWRDSRASAFVLVAKL